MPGSSSPSCWPRRPGGTGDRRHRRPREAPSPKCVMATTSTTSCRARGGEAAVRRPPAPVWSTWPTAGSGDGRRRAPVAQPPARRPERSGRHRLLVAFPPSGAVCERLVSAEEEHAAAVLEYAGRATPCRRAPSPRTTEPPPRHPRAVDPPGIATKLTAHTREPGRLPRLSAFHDQRCREGRVNPDGHAARCRRRVAQTARVGHRRADRHARARKLAAITSQPQPPVVTASAISAAGAIMFCAALHPEGEK